MFNLDFYRGKNVLITGHTGFKGSWLTHILVKAGANVTGISLGLPSEPSLFKILNLEKGVRHVKGDIRVFNRLKNVFAESSPEIVFHLAAQPIVRESYKSPRETYETNVMGTVNVLECIRVTESVRSSVIVTTDKVYLNHEWEWGYRENDILDGFDPYSNSKSCAELVTHSYIRSFFDRRPSLSVSTTRAGNVIGGGDFAADRIIPDCIRAVSSGKKIQIRNPFSIRPYQHVLEPICAYLMIAERQFADSKFSDSYNIGPNDTDCISTGELVDLFIKKWGNGAECVVDSEDNGPHEANFLKLDCSKIKRKFGWMPKWDICEAVEKTCTWTEVWLSGGDVESEMNRQVEAYLS